MRVIAPLAAVALMAAPMAAGAQNLLEPAAQVTAPPPGFPHAFTPAPVPSVGPAAFPPADRAGGAADAGPMNATPFSGGVSTLLTGTQTGRTLGDSRPYHDPAAAVSAPE